MSATRPVLLTGFGPFLDVGDNPSARLVRALDGLEAGPWRLEGRVLDVSYGRLLAQVLEWCTELEPAWVLGFGVSRSGVLRVESRGVAEVVDIADVEGFRPTRLDGPPEVWATLDVGSLAELFNCPVSEDAGQYVCNAWLHQVCQHAPCPSAFVHIPAAGISAERAHRAISLFRPGQWAPNAIG